MSVKEQTAETMDEEQEGEIERGTLTNPTEQIFGILWHSLRVHNRSQLSCDVLVRGMVRVKGLRIG